LPCLQHRNFFPCNDQYGHLKYWPFLPGCSCFPLTLWKAPRLDTSSLSPLSFMTQTWIVLLCLPAVSLHALTRFLVRSYNMHLFALFLSLTFTMERTRAEDRMKIASLLLTMSSLLNTRKNCQTCSVTFDNSVWRLCDNRTKTSWYAFRRKFIRWKHDFPLSPYHPIIFQISISPNKIAYFLFVIRRGANCELLLTLFTSIAQK